MPTWIDGHPGKRTNGRTRARQCDLTDGQLKRRHPHAAREPESCVYKVERPGEQSAITPAKLVNDSYTSRLPIRSMPGLLTLPPFPDDVPTHPLLVIDYELLIKRDEAEIDKLWKAATELGFW